MSTSPITTPRQPPRDLPAGSSYPIGSLAGLLTSLRALLDSVLRLAICEAKQAGIGLAFMLAFGIAAAMLVTIGLGSIVACVVIVLVANELLNWPAALIVAAVFCFAAGGAFVMILVRRSNLLLFKATRRQLGGS
jgi:uncharacterized membrane protein YqjE